MRSKALLPGSVSLLLTAGCASQDGKYSLYHSANHGEWTATLSNYGGADAAKKLDAFVTDYCDGPFMAEHRMASDDGQTHHVQFECGNS